jgi:ribosomal protein S18 acetylase RimI-like enzyme
VKIRLREFRREDFVELWNIDQSCFPAGISYSRQELAAFIRQKSTFTLVAEAGAGPDQEAPESSAIAGFIVAEVRRNRSGHVITIDVPAQARRCGVGSQLLAAAEKRLRGRDCRRVVLETAVDNGAALAFYKRHGYFITRTAPGYYSTGVDAFVLEKDLLSQVSPDKVLAS